MKGVRNFLGHLPSGYRFSPTDEELFHHYLIPKRRGLPVHGPDISEIDLYNYNPWHIPGIDPTKKKLCDQVWYFFCIRVYHNNDTFKRKAGCGFWKSTGDPRSVTAEGSDVKIGTVRILVFYNPNATHWVMHEFEHTAEPNSQFKDNYVLCRIKLQPTKKKAVKRLRKAEQSCETPNAKKKARKGKLNRNMVSASTAASENQNLTDIMPSSNYHKGAAAATYGMGESSNPDSCSFMNQSDDSTSNRCLVASDLENYNPSGMAEISDLENCCILDKMVEMPSNKKVKPTRCTTAACSENQNSFPTIFGNKNQNSYERTIVSSNNKDEEKSYPMKFGDENQNSNEMMFVASPNNKVETSHPLNFGNENQKNKMTHQSFCPVTSGNESLSQEVDTHQRPIVISNSQEATLQEKPTDEYSTLDTSRSYFNFQGNRTGASIWMPPNGGEAMSGQADPELVEADREAFNLLLELLCSEPEQPISDEGKPK